MSETDLTVLCVTKAESYAQSFLARLAQDASIVGAVLRVETDDASIQSAGYIESALDDAIARCDTDYILRIDDDETMSLAMLEWLRRREYRSADHWAFPRRNLWPDAQQFVANPPLWPDLQTRLSVKAKAGGRAGVHDGSPFGTGEVAPVAIEHHKFLARTRGEREELVRHYDELRPGAGAEYVMFSLPELYDGELALQAIG
jgi:hypothetical protein